MLISGIARSILLVVLGLQFCGLGPTIAAAQEYDAWANMPAFWDVKRRPDKPNLEDLHAIRFLTEEDYPPFNFINSAGAPAGFNVDLAREACAELELVCTIQIKRWDSILAALEAGQADAAIASLRPTKELRRTLLFTDPYYRTPARFVAKTSTQIDPSPAGLAEKRIGVVRGSAHEAYAAAFFPKSSLVAVETEDAALAALVKGEVDAVFADGISLAFWLNGTASAACCRFVGGPYLESHFFGEGIGIAVHKQNSSLKAALDYALLRLWERGVYGDLTKRWFPLNPYRSQP